MRIIIKGKPKYQKRHRHGKGRTWDPSAKDKDQIRLLSSDQITTRYEIPIRVEITAYYPFLKSWTKAEQAIGEGAPKITRPDADNISKIYLDALNEIAWTDDNIITELTVRKLYSREPCVVIEVEPYEV